MATTLAEHISLHLEGDVYVSNYTPQRLGNSASIAYGGYAIALAIHSAYQAAPDEFHLYSVCGHYLRATNTHENLICKVIRLRETMSFATYRVIVRQKQANDEMRTCVEVSADFHKEEPSLLVYSTRPSREYSHWKDCDSWQNIEQCWAEAGRLSEARWAAFQELFGLSRTLYEGRPCFEGIVSQNLLGFSKDSKTTQDHLPMPRKSSAEWFRAKHALQTEGEQMAGLAFILDGMLSFLPLAHAHLFLDDVAACASLDFAFRIFSPAININKWHLRELISHHGGNGRTYSETRVWDEAGNMVASMTQQCILRPLGHDTKL